MAHSPSSSSPVIRDVIAARVSRRGLLKGGIASGALLAGGSFVGSLFTGESHAAAAQSTLGFPELKRVYDKTHAVADGYEAAVVARWGDALAAGLPEFDGNKVTADEQDKRFGYNCDYIGFMPLPKGSTNSDHGLLCVNNEYISPNVMFPGMTEDDAGAVDDQGAGRSRHGRDGPFDRRGDADRRQMADRRRQPAQPPHHRRTPKW